MLGQLLMLAVLAMPQTTTPVDSAVVFVCEHGAAKSVIAAAYFNKIAAERGLRARAIYRGVNPQADLSISAMNGLKQDGINVDEHKPSRIEQPDVDAANVIFAIGCPLPANATASGKADSWDDVPDDQGYAATRDAIKRHVEQLVDSLLKQQQRLAIARALACKPIILLLDEPFSSADRETRLSLYGWIRAVSPQVSGPTIYVTHNAEDAQNLAEHAIRLTDRKLVVDDHPWQTQAD